MLGIGKVIRILILGVFLSASQAISAEFPANQGDFLIQQEQQRQRQLEREVEQSKPGRSVILPNNPTKISEQPANDGPCFTINHVQVEGAELFPSADITAIYQPSIGQCLNVSSLHQLVGKITSLYVDAGYLTSRAYIPQQNLSGGSLRIVVVEGIVEAVEIQGDSAKRLVTAFPDLVGKRLNLRDIEQGVDVFTQSGAEAKVDFLPGEKVGGTRVVIRVNPRKAHMVSAGFDDNGQESTGKNRISLTGTWDNVAGVNDNLWLNLQTTAPSQQRDNQSQSLAVTYAVPLGAWQFAMAQQSFDYRSEIHRETSFVSEGDSSVWSLDAKRLLMRNQTRLFHFGAKLKQQDIENRIQGQRLVTSSRTYSALELYLTAQQLWGAHQLNNRLSVWRGLSSDQADLGANTPDSDFTKFTLDTNWQSRWEWAGRAVIWRSDLFGQFSDANLYSSEALSIGGKYSVRGFELASSQGNTGAYWRNSLSTLIQGNVDSAGYWQPYMAIDAGEIEHGPMQVGAALGANYSGQNLQIQLEVSKSLVTEELPSDVVQKDIGLNLSWRW